jgi:DNA-binding MarR family transcriptional regulator
MDRGQRDQVDSFIEQWERERPDLDAAPLGLVSRLLTLGKTLEHGADQALAPYGLTLWQLDVLAALRRAGPPFQLSPTQLAQQVTLSSGAMTNRIDRLEAAGLVQRLADPEDRRGVRIALTPAGLTLADEAIAAHLRHARQNVNGLTAREVRVLARLLRRLMLSHGLRARPIGAEHGPTSARSGNARHMSVSTPGTKPRGGTP